MTTNEWWMFGFVLVLTAAYFASQRAAYKNGVWDGAYNDWLPHVQDTLNEYHNPGSVKACQRDRVKDLERDVSRLRALAEKVASADARWSYAEPNFGVLLSLKEQARAALSQEPPHDL